MYCCSSCLSLTTKKAHLSNNSGKITESWVTPPNNIYLQVKAQLWTLQSKDGKRNGIQEKSGYHCTRTLYGPHNDFQHDNSSIPHLRNLRWNRYIASQWDTNKISFWRESLYHLTQRKWGRVCINVKLDSGRMVKMNPKRMTLVQSHSSSTKSL